MDCVFAQADEQIKETAAVLASALIKYLVCCYFLSEAENIMCVAAGFGVKQPTIQVHRESKRSHVMITSCP